MGLPDIVSYACPSAYLYELKTWARNIPRGSIVSVILEAMANFRQGPGERVGSSIAIGDGVHLLLLNSTVEYCPT